MTSKIGYGCCVGSWERFQRYVAPRIGDRPLLGLAGQTSITVAYNSIIDAYRGRGLDAIVLLHDDLEITDSDAEAKILAALEDETVALVGVAGGRQPTNEHTVLAWWDISGCVGHQLTDSYLIDFGPRGGDVDTPEGSIIALSSWAVENVRFDKEVPGFHGYDVDIGLQVRSRGRRVVVVDLDTHHHTTIGFESPETAAAWRGANAYVAAKWNVGGKQYVGG